MTAKGAYEELAVINDSTCGLSAGLITKYLEKALFLTENLESCMVYIDDAWDHDPYHYPFERYKENRPIRESETLYMQEMFKRKP